MNRKRGYLYILLAAMIYSTTEVALKGLGGVFAPMQITVERVLIGALFCCPLPCAACGGTPFASPAPTGATLPCSAF